MGASTLLTPDDIAGFNRRVDARIIMREIDQSRRDAWKRRARQHHIDQAGVCTGESECPCPNCREYREFYRLRLGESLHKIHIGHDDRGRVVKWVWVRRSDGWRRKDIHTRRIFGPSVQHVDPSDRSDPSALAAHYIRTSTVGSASIRDEVIVHETNPGGGDSWVKAKFADAGAYMSREQATEFYRNHYGLPSSFKRIMTKPPPYISLDQATEFYRQYRSTFGVDTPWADPPRKPDLLTPEDRASFLHGDWSDKKEHPVLTPLQFAILYYYAAFPDAVWSRSAPACGVHEAHLWLIDNELLEDSSTSTGYHITERAKVYMRAINLLPLPIRKPAPWTMPGS